MRKWSLKRYFTHLKAHLPLDAPVKLRVCHMVDSGDISYDANGCTIRLNVEQSLAEQKSTLDHEWAHGLAGWTDKHQHTAKWGREYARVYRLMQDEV